jgi:hypothetical protein
MSSYDPQDAIYLLPIALATAIAAEVNNTLPHRMLQHSVKTMRQTRILFNETHALSLRDVTREPCG